MTAGLMKQFENVSFLNELISLDCKSVSLPSDPKNKSIILIQDKKNLLKFQSQSLKLEQCLILINQSLWDKLEVATQKEFLQKYSIGVSNNFDKTICKLSKIVHDQRINSDQKLEVHESAKIHPSAVLNGDVRVEENVQIDAHVQIQGPVIIKKGSRIFSNVSIYPYVDIAENVRIHSMCTIGADGFGYKFIEGTHHKIWHSGGVVIEANVEVGCNTAIDSGTFVPTIIGEGTKIDSHVMIAHNVNIGKNCIICGKVGLAGSAKIGDFTVLAGNSVIGPSVELGKQCQVAGGGQVNKSWPDGSIVAGYPATSLKEWRRSVIKFQQSGR